MYLLYSNFVVDIHPVHYPLTYMTQSLVCSGKKELVPPSDSTYFFGIYMYNHRVNTSSTYSMTPHTTPTWGINYTDSTGSPQIDTLITKDN